MNNPNALKTFDNKRIRTLWDETQEKWYFSVVDVIEALTESKNPTDYLKKMRKRDDQLGIFIGTNCPQVVMVTETGKKRITLAADTQQLLRIIQSVPSVKAEPFKIWMAKVASDRLDQIQDPELSIKQAMQDYKRLGYSDNWINQRIKSIEIRKELTDEWKKKGLQESIHFATLTDIIYQSWSDMTAREYKKFKGLKKENLRDNMTNKELVLNMLAEISTKEISENSTPENFDDHKEIAAQGGEVAKNARLELERKTGKSVISPLNAKDILHLDAKNDID